VCEHTDSLFFPLWFKNILLLLTMNWLLSLRFITHFFFFLMLIPHQFKHLWSNKSILYPLCEIYIFFIIYSLVVFYCQLIKKINTKYLNLLCKATLVYLCIQYQNFLNRFSVRVLEQYLKNSLVAFLFWSILNLLFNHFSFLLRYFMGFLVNFLFFFMLSNLWMSFENLVSFC